jgi:hypothetical protein
MEDPIRGEEGEVSGCLVELHKHVPIGFGSWSGEEMSNPSSENRQTQSMGNRFAGSCLSALRGERKALFKNPRMDRASAMTPEEKRKRGRKWPGAALDCASETT